MAYICPDMRYVVLSLIGAALVYGQCNQCTPDPAINPTPYGFKPDPLRLPPDTNVSLAIYFTFPDQVQQGTLTVYPNYAIWVDSLRLDQGLITAQDGGTFAYNASDPSAGPIIFDQPHRYKQWGSEATDYANFVVYQNPGTSAGPAGQTPPIGCARVCIRTSSTEGSDTLRVKVRVFVNILGDVDNKDTTNIRGILGRVDTTFRYAIVISRSSSLSRGLTNVYDLRIQPNPAYQEAILSYTLPNAMAVSLSVYALDGRKVLSRDLGLKPAGTHQETLRLPAGQYLIRLETLYGFSTTRLTVIE
jgi:hypothetical protein